MATQRKLGLVFGALFAVFASVFLFSAQASALTPTPAQARAAGPFEYIDSERIRGTINNQPVIFTFQNDFARAPGDTGTGSLASAFVANDVTCGNNKAYIRGGNSQLYISAQSGSGGNCQWIQRQVTLQNRDFSTSVVKWIDAGTIQTIKKLGGIPEGTNFTQRGDTGNFFRQGESECVDQIVVVGARATVYELKPGPDEAPANEIGLPQFGNCEVLSINGTEINDREEGRRLANQRLAISLPENRSRPAGAGGGAGAEVGEPSCESENNTGLEWMICPLLVGIDSAVNGINGIILDQLDFNPDTDLGEAVNGGEGNRDNNGVKLTWNIVKNISTFLIIIIMLIMVLSTTISWGPFDAYTIRQVLPRLVIAIIAMQLSWEFLIFIIELTNDIGRGLADLMYAPFGGAQELTLSALIGGGTSEAAATSIFATAVIAAGIGAVISPFGILVLAISAVASIFIGLIVLLLRNILIILCLMLAPLAILFWVLPGTRNYWNFWQETFGKLMLMFPFIVALLASGRIFAHITGTSTDGAIAGGLINFIAAIVGIFGPFWLLPKTLQWGGRAFSNITGVLQNSKTKGMFDRSKNFARQRGKELKAQRDAASGERLAQGKRRPTDLLKASQLDPTIRFGANAQRVRQQKMGAFVAAGRALQQQQLKDAQNRVEVAIEGQSFGDSLKTLEGIAKDSGRSEYERRAAISTLAGFKGVDQIDGVRTELLQTSEGQRIWNIAVGENFSDLKKLSPHLSKDSAGTASWLSGTPADQARAFTDENDELLSSMRKEGWAKFASLDLDKARATLERIDSNENISSNLNPAAATDILQRLQARNVQLRNAGQPEIDLTSIEDIVNRR